MSFFGKNQGRINSLTTICRILLLVLVAGYAGEFLHTTFTPHTICPEHGEAVELENTPGVTHSAVADFSAGHAVGGDHHCEQCCVFAQNRKRHLSFSQTTLLFQSPHSCELVQEATIGFITGFSDLYLLAPKNSPPFIV